MYTYQKYLTTPVLERQCETRDIGHEMKLINELEPPVSRACFCLEGVSVVKNNVIELFYASLWYERSQVRLPNVQKKAQIHQVLAQCAVK